MKGFFDGKEYEAERPRTKNISGCGACGLHKLCNSPKMEAAGKGKEGILIIGEAPNEEEDDRGKHFRGESGQLLRKHLRKLDIDLDRDCRMINAINCRPPKDAEANWKQIDACRPRVWKEIEEFKPDSILLLGVAALRSFLGHRWKKDLEGITKWRGWVIPDKEVEAWVVPTFHPSFIGRNSGWSGKKDAAETIFQQDLELLINSLDDPLPSPSEPEDCIHWSEDPEEIEQTLHEIHLTAELIAFDFETTGLKPYAKGHDIITCSICPREDYSFAFPLLEDAAIEESLIEILEEESIRKIAANMKFEKIWAEVILDAIVKGWFWDTMQAAHIEDNRKGVTSLAFQIYVQFGIVDFKSVTDPFLKAPGKKPSDNDFNRIREVPMEELLKRNALDSLHEFRLAQAQRKALR